MREGQVQRGEAGARQCNACADYFDETTIAGAVHLATCCEHNGWANYETWSVASHIDNDEGMHRGWTEEAAQHLADALESGDDREGAALSLGEIMKERFAEAAEETVQPGSLELQMVTAAYGEVDWAEIAAHLLPVECMCEGEVRRADRRAALEADAEQVRCCYCGRLVVEIERDADLPPAGDDEAWAKLGAAHSPSCEWARTRAHRREA